jgi:hypothetical protein
MSKKKEFAAMSFKNKKDNIFIGSQKIPGESRDDHKKRMELMRKMMVQVSNEPDKNKKADVFTEHLAHRSSDTDSLEKRREDEIMAYAKKKGGSSFMCDGKKVTISKDDSRNIAKIYIAADNIKESKGYSVAAQVLASCFARIERNKDYSIEKIIEMDKKMEAEFRLSRKK